MNLRQRIMGFGLRAMNRFGGSRLAQRLVRGAAHGGFRTVGTIGRSFVAARKLLAPARLTTARGGDLFDLTPTDEQAMLRGAVSSFASKCLRPAAAAADIACAAPAELLNQSAELGITLLGVPEELDGAGNERSAMTNVLIAEALAHGDMGLALACLAPAAVSTALTLWGDEGQQASYLPAFVGGNLPAAALALLEPRPLFNPFKLDALARRTGGGYVLDGVKSLVPRAAQAELFIVAARLDEGGPALFIVESNTAGVRIVAEPAMGLRAAATGRLLLDGVLLPASALLASGGSYAQCVQLARLGWCALALGTAQAVLDYVVPYTRERITFGEPIAQRQSVAFAVADIGIELEGMRLLTYRAASRAEQGLSFARETALARQLCAREGMRIGSQGVQLLGGHGFVKDHPVERWYRDLRAAGVMEGALLV